MNVSALVDRPVSSTLPTENAPASQSLDLSSLLKYRRIAIAVGDDATDFVAKTAIGLLRYRGDDVIAIVAADQAGRSAQDVYRTGGSIPVVGSLEEVDHPDAVFIGIAPHGGKLTESLQCIVAEAVAMGVDVVSGLHEFLSDDPTLKGQSERTGSQLIDVRKNSCQQTAKALAFRPGCLRVHTVGHDCSVGKMTVALEVETALKKQQVDARFLATGQTGIMIAGDGIPVDCIASDFVNGAVEDLVWRHQGHDVLLIEGQGSITHPSCSGVTLGLLHGCAPQAMIMCIEAGRTHVKGHEHVELHDLKTLCFLYELMAAQRHPSKIIGIAVNTRYLSAEQASAEVERIRSQYGLPVCDVFRDGADVLADAVISMMKE